MHSANWDAEAEKALHAFAQLRAAGRDDLDLTRTIHDSTQSAVAIGCTDPLIRYLHARFASDQLGPDPHKYADHISTIAEELNRSGYPPVRRFYGCLRAAEASVVTIAEDRTMPDRLIALRFGACTELFAKNVCTL
jgi:hypothetical protein